MYTVSNIPFFVEKCRFFILNLLFCVQALLVLHQWT